MTNFDDLVSARKHWIHEILKPWCIQARRSELLKAEVEWLDIAGKVAAEKTLWLWAWSRFPDLVHESLGIEETSQVDLQLRDGRNFRGYPDSRQSTHGQLVLFGHDSHSNHLVELGPFSIDEVACVRRVAE